VSHNPETFTSLATFAQGLATRGIRMIPSGLTGDLLMVNQQGDVVATIALSGDYTLAGAIAINGTDLIVEVDNLQLLSRDPTRNLVGLNTLAGSPAVVGNDVPAVAAARLGKVDLTAQVANIASTNLSNTPPAGLYAVEAYLLTTTADAAAGTLALNVAWTDGVGATNANLIAAHSLAATGRSQGRQLIQLASGNIAYSVTVTGLYGTAAYAVYVRVIALG
jgi:hypothetical protein